MLAIRIDLISIDLPIHQAHTIDGVVTNTGLAGTEPQVGEKLFGVVLYVDHLARCLELSCDQDIVRKVTLSKGEPLLKLLPFFYPLKY